jgi:hypothetical protein
VKRILYRDAVKEDWGTIKAFHVEQQRLQNTDYELPDLFDGPFPIVRVGVDEDGVIRNCFYVEAVAELRLVGVDAAATAFSQREADALSNALKIMGCRYLECFVPQQLKGAISKPLLRAGFEDKEPELAYFSRDLR